ncbi:DUF6898 family protein [Brevundimonas naejangsanensis]|uniref:DUF6898 family protein n=1 Tax=Brevundimonas naejangsanensis TaxID=588932 RepID=UPI0039C85E89
MTDADLGEVIVEFVRNGPYVKCSAVHAASGVEVSPPSAPPLSRARSNGWLSPN